MNSILENLLAQRGVLATLVISAEGRVLHQVSIPLHEMESISAVARALRRCADALASLETCWENADVCFVEGTLLLRTLRGSVGPDGEAGSMLAIIADRSADRSTIAEEASTAARRLEIYFQSEEQEPDLRRPSRRAFEDPAAEEVARVLTLGLARFVGPMSKVFVREAIGAVCGDRPFGISDAMPVMREAAGSIDSTIDRDAFLSLDLAELPH
ncbi:MAG: hypothetical protein AAFZ18_03570 [Myxococcota bacterium]